MTSAFNRWFVRFGFRIGLGILVLIAFLYYAQKQNLQSSFNWVFHSSQVQQELTNLARSIELSGTSEAIENNILTIQNLVFDNPRELKRIATLRELQEKKQMILGDPGLSKVAQNLKIDGLNEQLLTIIAEMRTEESRLLEEREKLSKNNISLLDFPIIVGGLFAFFLIYMANRITRQDLKELIRKDEELQKQARSLLVSKDALEVQTKILNLTIESMAEGLVVINEDSEFVQFNPEARKLLGFGPEALTDRDAALPTLLRDPKTHIGIEAEDSPLVRSLKGEYISDLEYETTPPSGPSRILSFNSRPIVDISGRKFGALVVFHDITDEKTIEDQLRKASKAAEETAQVKSTFLANMSHEIRTPMNGILGMTEILKNTQLPAKQRSYVELIESSCRSLLIIINDILDFSKIEAGKLDIEKTDFNLAYTVGRTVQLLAPQAHEKNLTLLSYISPKIPDRVRGDSGRIGQILVNLLSNAVKFTEKGKVIVWVDLVHIYDHKIEVKFTVEDSGVGIPAEKIPKLFQPFTQADTSTSRKYGGTGLGLSICKQLVNLMNGEISVNSSLGKGSTFSFTIPFEIPMIAESERSAQQFPVDFQILIYDEDSTSSQILIDYITSWNLNPFHLKNISEFKAALKNEAFLKKYDLLFISAGQDTTDLEAPLMFMQDLSSKPQAVIITDNGAPEYLEPFKKFGIRHFLLQPLDQSMLYNCLMHCLAERGTFDDIQLSQSQVDTEPKEPFDKPYRILLAEDNMVNQLIAQSFLKELGYSVQTVANGKEVLKTLEHSEFDLILMDCQMPEMDGFEATKEIRVRFSKQLPIIALTANAMKGDEENCREAGMNGYLSKPFRKDQLQAILKKFLSLEKVGFNPSKLEMLKGYKDDQDRDLRITLIETFIKTATTSLQELTKFADTDPDSFKRVAHTFKSTSAALGGTVLTSLLESLENETLDLSNRKEKLKDVEKEFQNLKPHLESYLKNLA